MTAPWHAAGTEHTDQGAEPPLGVVLTCAACDTSYEPTADDLAAGRTACPDPDCGGWAFAAELVEPPAGGDPR